MSEFDQETPVALNGPAGLGDEIALRKARTELCEALSKRFTNLFTAIVGNCDLVLAELGPEHPAVLYLVAAKRAAFQASDVNSRLAAVVRECREAND